MAALRSLRVAPPHDASRALPAPFLGRTHLTPIYEMSSSYRRLVVWHANVDHDAERMPDLSIDCRPVCQGQGASCDRRHRSLTVTVWRAAAIPSMAAQRRCGLTPAVPPDTSRQGSAKQLYYKRCNLISHLFAKELINSA
ncbi:hypothetical protein Hrubri_0749 [Herbaspirillum rubrisubalbicans M1]|nr:hypothetical protein Hrubri_0749 [Herbaspirillum rubrisubalbicans M1]